MIMTAQPAATGAPSYSETLPRHPKSARRARLLVTAALHTWGLPLLIDSGILLVSELVSNAVEHTRSSGIRVAVRRPEPGRVRIAVTDRSRWRPSPLNASSQDEKGRGLAVVEAIADRWGITPLPWGKQVWVELECRTEPS